MAIYFTEFIYNKSMLGFMGIYEKPTGDINKMRQSHQPPNAHRSHKYP